MNLKLLKETEKQFFDIYPEGFNDEAMVKISKKHRLSKISEFCREVFAEEEFVYEEQIIQNMVKLVNKSSMVSLFEKPKFRDMVAVLDDIEKHELVSGLKDLLHGDEERGFNTMLEILKTHRMAKWTIMTVFRCYYYPETDLLFKPTTVKGIIKRFELEDIKYHPTPSYGFFVKYRAYIREMMKHVDPSLTSSGAAFSGFLMMTL